MGRAQAQHRHPQGAAYTFALRGVVGIVVVITIFTLRHTGLVGVQSAAPAPQTGTSQPGLLADQGARVGLRPDQVVTGTSTDQAGNTQLIVQNGDGSSQLVVVPAPSSSTASPAPASTSNPNLPSDPGPSPTPDPDPSPNPEPTPPPTEPTPPPSPAPPPAPTYTYRNGTYYYEASFGTPGGTERLGISLTISADQVTATSATKLAVHPTSKSYENSFVASYGSSVVGRDLATLSLSRTAGASLTTNGFNSAVIAIRNMAL